MRIIKTSQYGKIAQQSNHDASETVDECEKCQGKGCKECNWDGTIPKDGTVKCPDCGGNGTFSYGEIKCQTCDGAGYVWEKD